MMTEETFAAFKEFIEGNVGIRLPPAKKVMLEARLAKRVRALGFSTHEEYRDYVFGPEGFAASARADRRGHHERDGLL